MTDILKTFIKMWKYSVKKIRFPMLGAPLILPGKNFKVKRRKYNILPNLIILLPLVPVTLLLLILDDLWGDTIEINMMFPHIGGLWRDSLKKVPIPNLF